MFTLLDFLQILLFLGLLIFLSPILGNYMFHVITGNHHLMMPILGRVEKFIYRFAGINPDEETNWKVYLYGLMVFHLFGFIFLFLVQVFQMYVPLNPMKLGSVSWHSAFNTSVSFITNTNWQGYAGETTMSYFVQMIGLTVQNFVSAATGIAVLLVIIRGISRKKTDKLGNFWTDLTRITIYIFFPLSILLAVFLSSQGVIQNFNKYETIHTLEGEQQIIPMGPVASQTAIKQLGTNGGGFFNANSSHPFENPTPVSNFIELLCILLIPASLTYTFGKMVGSVRQGRAIFFTMMIVFVVGLTISLYAEYAEIPAFGNQSSMEGKETRFGIVNSILWSTATSAASNGSVNAMHDSLSPLSGMVAMINIMLGEIIFGGVGSGIYGILVFIILTVFMAGLMVGRSPEFLGKKIEAFEVQMALLAILCPNFVILFFSAWASVTSYGLTSITNHGAHGFSEILYAYCSAAGNNGSAFAGLNTNTIFYNLTLGAGMLIGRFGVIIPVFAIAGSLAKKKIIPVSTGTLRTDNLTFIVLLIAVILIVGGLTFFPALSVGPLSEHLLLINGKTY